MRRLTDPRHLRFVMAFLKPGITQAEAAREAGYQGSDTTLGTQALRLLKRPEIAREIERRRDMSLRRASWSLERSIENLVVVGDSDMADFAHLLDAKDPVAAFRELPPDLTKAVKGLRVKDESRAARHSSPAAHVRSGSTANCPGPRRASAKQAGPNIH